MHCSTCGTQLEPGVHFCPKCGQPAAQYNPLPPPPVATHYGYPAPLLKTRVQAHIQTAGILWCVYAAYRVIEGLIGMFVLKVISSNGYFGAGWPFNGMGYTGTRHGFLAALVPVVGVITLASVALSVFVGYSLLTRRPWGRTLAIVAALLALFKFPLGTALGIYTLWLLASGASAAEYEAIADRT